MSESNIITICLECGSTDIVKTINSIYDNAYHCHNCFQEYFEDVYYSSYVVDPFEFKKLKNQKKIMKEALEFYADRANWRRDYDIDSMWTYWIMDSSDLYQQNESVQCCGERARQALKAVEDE